MDVCASCPLPALSRERPLQGRSCGVGFGFELPGGEGGQGLIEPQAGWGRLGLGAKERGSLSQPILTLGVEAWWLVRGREGGPQ